MIQRRTLWLACLCAGLAACGGPPATDQNGQAIAATQAASTQTTGGTMETEVPTAVTPGAAAQAVDLDATLKQGMPYADARETLLAAGWQPVRDAQCRANVIGENHAELCAANPGLTGCKACDDLPELSACSSDGYCSLKFRHAADGRNLQVTTYGMIEDRHVKGPDSRLDLWAWSIDGGTGND